MVVRQQSWIYDVIFFSLPHPFCKMQFKYWGFYLDCCVTITYYYILHIKSTIHLHGHLALSWTTVITFVCALSRIGQKVLRPKHTPNARHFSEYCWPTSMLVTPWTPCYKRAGWLTLIAKCRASGICLGLNLQMFLFITFCYFWVISQKMQILILTSTFIVRNIWINRYAQRNMMLIRILVLNVTFIDFCFVL